MKHEALLPATSANQSGIGPLPNAPLLAATTPKRSFAELQTIVWRKSTRAMRGTPSRQLKPHCNARSAKWVALVEKQGKRLNLAETQSKSHERNNSNCAGGIAFTARSSGALRECG